MLIPTGEMELTFMATACRAANLRSLLQLDSIRNIVREFTDIYNGLFNENKRGTRLRDTVLGDENDRRQAMVRESNCASQLEEPTWKALVSFLNAELGKEVFVDIRDLRMGPGLCQVSNAVLDCPSMFFHGVTYKPVIKSSKDSNIVFSPPGSSHTIPCSGRIKQIFVHRRRNADGNGDDLREIFLSVERLQDLSPDDVQWDKYRKFLHIGGHLCYDSYRPSPLIIRPNQIISHFARTAIDIPHIQKACVHVLPLNRVRHLRKLSHYVLTRDAFMASCLPW